MRIRTTHPGSMATTSISQHTLRFPDFTSNSRSDPNAAAGRPGCVGETERAGFLDHGAGRGGNEAGQEEDGLSSWYDVPSFPFVFRLICGTIF
jgi:hypothetical protein